VPQLPESLLCQAQGQRVLLGGVQKKTEWKINEKRPPNRK